MTKKVAHIYASSAKQNSGDFMIGIAYKQYFKQIILENNYEIKYTDFDCRSYFDETKINELNTFDYIILGGGGLFLPDTSPNNNSGWQWNIKTLDINKIIKPIYVLSVGYNLFFNQDMSMSSRESNLKNPKLLDLFKENVMTLIDDSVFFSLRHKSDCNNLLKIVGEKYRDKIHYEKCATVWYVDKFWKNKMLNIEKSIAIEVKDDREWRRYYKIEKKKYYNELKKIVEYCLDKNISIVYLSHDGSKNFYNYLKSHNIIIPLLDNSCGNENKIIENYSKIHTILCSAGHSQMISNGCGIKIISLITHPKIRNYCDDIGDTNYVDVNNLLNENEIFLRIKNLLNSI